jgi:hypothetical protein
MTLLDVAESAHSRLPEADYADAFRVTAEGYHSPERWARRALESGPALQRRLFALTVWQCSLGLRLGPSDSRHHVAGWAIVENEPEILVLRAQSWLITGVMVFEASDSAAIWTTLVEYEARPAGAVWGVIGIGHRRLAPRALNGARRFLVGISGQQRRAWDSNPR